MNDEPIELTREQLAALKAATEKLQQMLSAALQGFAAALPILAAAAAELGKERVRPEEPLEPLDLDQLKAALSDGAAELPRARFDREGKWRYRPSAN